MSHVLFRGIPHVQLKQLKAIHLTVTHWTYHRSSESKTKVPLTLQQLLNSTKHQQNIITI